MITGEGVIAARRLIRWMQMTLALEASVLQSTVMKFETGNANRQHSPFPASSARPKTASASRLG